MGAWKDTTFGSVTKISRPPWFSSRKRETRLEATLTRDTFVVTYRLVRAGATWECCLGKGHRARLIQFTAASLLWQFPDGTVSLWQITLSGTADAAVDSPSGTSQDLPVLAIDAKQRKSQSLRSCACTASAVQGKGQTKKRRQGRTRAKRIARARHRMLLHQAGSKGQRWARQV